MNKARLYILCAWVKSSLYLTWKGFRPGGLVWVPSRRRNRHPRHMVLIVLKRSWRPLDELPWCRRVWGWGKGLPLSSPAVESLLVAWRVEEIGGWRLLERSQLLLLLLMVVTVTSGSSWRGTSVEASSNWLSVSWRRRIAVLHSCRSGHVSPRPNWRVVLRWKGQTHVGSMGWPMRPWRRVGY